MDFNRAPFIVIWETTQACDLACVHCRAKAQPLPLFGELSHEEGLALLDEIAGMGTKVCVLSGGDPLKRADLLGLIRHGKSRGLRMATIPAATPLLTRDVVQALKDAGLDQMALSLDASTPGAHDRFRNAPLRTIYQASPIFQALRDPNCLKGRCGACEYRAICGGSRSRAYAVSGDDLAEGPCCAYLPCALQPASVLQSRTASSATEP